MANFKVSAQQNLEHAISNRIYFNSSDHGYLLNKFGVSDKNKVYIQIKNFVYKTDISSYCKKGEICLSKLQRENLMLSTTMDYAEVQCVYIPNSNRLLLSFSPKMNTDYLC